jgi:hypothetical protein
MDIISESKTLLLQKRLSWTQLQTSIFANEYKTVSNQLASTNARQILWHVLNGDKIPVCKCGSDLKWHPDLHRYRDYCSNKCTATYTQDKIKETNIKKYGVAHFSKTDEYNEKVKSTSLAKYGAAHYSKTDEFKNNVKQTNLDKFGVEYPAQSSAILARMQETTMNTYGVNNPMHSDIVKAKLANTNIQKYGVPNVLSSLAIRKKINTTVFDRYGVDHPRKIKSITEKASATLKQNHYSTYAYEKIHDVDWLTEQNKNGKSISEIADMLNISSSNLCKYFHKHGIEIKKHFRSVMEKDISDYIISHNIDVIHNDRKVLHPYEVDILIPSCNVGIELNGAYYHSERQGKTSEYHLNKTMLANHKNLLLLQFFDWEVFTKREVILDKINHVIGLNKKVGARTLTVVGLTKKEAASFFEKNHLQGKCGHSVAFGLANADGTILAAMSFGKSRYDKKYNWELLRFACADGIAVTGGASKLLKYFIKNNCTSGTSIVSYCNRRWSIGNLYTTLGFNYIKSSKPGYYYIKRNGEYAGTRLQFQKHMLADKLPIFDKSLSESDNMSANGYTKVWDCGQLVYELKV